VEIGNFFSTRKATDVTFRAIRFPTSPSLSVSISLFLLMRHYCVCSAGNFLSRGGGDFLPEETSKRDSGSRAKRIGRKGAGK